jgi:hypothetical protein
VKLIFASGTVLSLLALACCASPAQSGLDALMQRFPLGATHQDLSASIAAHCQEAVVHEYTAEQAAPYAQQTQVDCLGYEFSERPRKLELLINEGRLGFYWLLLEPAEIEATQSGLVRQLGQPTCESERDVIFEEAAIALRREPAEILVSMPEDFQAITGGCS